MRSSLQEENEGLRSEGRGSGYKTSLRSHSCPPQSTHLKLHLPKVDDELSHVVSWLHFQKDAQRANVFSFILAWISQQHIVPQKHAPKVRTGITHGPLLSKIRAITQMSLPASCIKSSPSLPVYFFITLPLSHQKVSTETGCPFPLKTTCKD
jgi:hypothetical protein